MLITALVPVGKTKTRVVIDEDRTLVLPNKDLGAFGVRLGEELPDETWNAIMQQFREEVLRKCGSLLTGGDYTAKGLRDRLIRSGYPEEIADEALAGMEEAGYIDDRRYAENYIRYHGEDRSRGRCRMDLLAKGVPAELVEEVMASLDQEEGDAALEREVQQIRSIMRKRRFDPDNASWEETQKLMAFLLRKGYSSDVIRAALRGE